MNRLSRQSRAHIPYRRGGGFHSLPFLVPYEKEAAAPGLGWRCIEDMKKQLQMLAKRA